MKFLKSPFSNSKHPSSPQTVPVSAHKAMIIRYILFMVLSIVLFISVIWLFQAIQSGKEAQRLNRYTFSSEELERKDYAKTAEGYRSTSDDARFYFPTLDDRLESVTVTFEQDIKEQIKVYTNDGGDFLEDNSSELYVIGRSAPIYVDRYAYEVRMDIGEKEGEEYPKFTVTFNDSETLERIWDLEIYFRLMLACVLFAVFMIYIMLFMVRVRIDQAAFWILLLIGLLYMLTITPYAVPDEYYHARYTTKLSNMMVFQILINYSDAIYINIGDAITHENTAGSYFNLMNDLFEPQVSDGTLVEMETNWFKYLPAYLPQAAGMSLGRVFGLNGIAVFYLGRLCSLLFSCGICAFAVKKIPQFKCLTLLIAMSPMFMQQAMSYSTDSVINSLALFLVASILKLILVDEKITIEEYITIVAISIFLAPIKWIYIFLVLLMVAIPINRYNSKKEFFLKTGFAIIAAFAVGIGVYLYAGIVNVTVDAVAELNWENANNFSISYILEHKKRVIWIFLYTLQNKWDYYLATALGSSLGGLSLPISLHTIGVFAILLALSVFHKENDTYILNFTCRSILFIVSGIITAAVLGAMLLDHTSDFRTVIEGVQGRYFIPIILPLLLVISNRCLVYKRNMDKILVFLAVLCNAEVIRQILSYTFGI